MKQTTTQKLEVKASGLVIIVTTRNGKTSRRVAGFQSARRAGLLISR